MPAPSEERWDPLQRNGNGNHAALQRVSQFWLFSQLSKKSMPLAGRWKGRWSSSMLVLTILRESGELYRSEVRPDQACAWSEAPYHTWCEEWGSIIAIYIYPNRIRAFLTLSVSVASSLHRIPRVRIWLFNIWCCESGGNDHTTVSLSNHTCTVCSAPYVDALHTYVDALPQVGANNRVLSTTFEFRPLLVVERFRTESWKDDCSRCERWGEVEGRSIGG